MSDRAAILQQRKDMILGLVVHEYIKTITPVSSAFIVKGYKLDWSSATIRNILAELEEEGLLTHPHTSAGRIPTEIGYRYYVDHLMDEMKLLQEEIQVLEKERVRIQQEYEREAKELDALLEKTSELITDLTQYTCIISIDGWGNKFICKGTSHVVQYPDSQDVDKIGNILRALEEKENILHLINRKLENNIQIYIGKEMACREMEQCSLAVSEFEGNRGHRGRIAVLGPTRMNYRKVVSTLDYVTDLMSEVL